MNVFDYFFKNTKDLEKDFVIGNRETISFKELYSNSLKIASYLKENFGTNENIILINHNSVFFITVYLGIIKSGNVCVPLDFSIEKDNFDFISQTTESSIIFCGKQFKSKLELNNFGSIIDEDFYEKVVRNTSVSDFSNNYDSKNLAEIIFTSGSTGKPKGVEITHKNIISNSESIISYLKIQPSDIMLVVLPFYYCYGLSLLHTHLRIGGSLVLNNTFMFIGTVVKDLIDFHCTGFAGVPSHFQLLLEKSDSFRKSDYPNLRYVTQAGGKLHNIFIEKFMDSFPKIEFYVMYGQTEATARLSYLPPNQLGEKIGSIGVAIPEVELKIVDENFVEVKREDIGEIVARGDNIMRGYFRDKNLTDSTLRKGWLCTGDIGRMDNDGFIFIDGRKKEIIKVGGKRVSPKEIEEVILSLSFVVDCKVVGVSDDYLGESLKAIVFLNSKTDNNLLQSEIKKACRKKLALHKIPQSFEFRDPFSLKPSGKRV